MYGEKGCMRTICESFVRITPALRSSIARTLIEKYDMSQADVARKLGVSQPAVSQYLKNIRGKGATDSRSASGSVNKIIRSSAVEEEVSKVCEKMVKENKVLYVEFCELCKNLRRRRLVCSMCGPDTSKELCDMCDDAC